MSGPSMQTIGGQSSAGQYGFVDPYGVTNQLKNSLYGGGGALSSGPMGLYNQYGGNVLGQVAGLSGPLQQTLSGIANYQAQNALNTTASNFANQGALGSGAAAQAFGQAIANPFAQAQAQLQQGQLQAGSQALGNLMQIGGQTYGQGLQAGSNLMEHASGLVAPTYYTQPGKGGGLGSGLLGAAGTIGGTALGGPLGGALGGALGGGAGKGAAQPPVTYQPQLGSITAGA